MVVLAMMIASCGAVVVVNRWGDGNGEGCEDMEMVRAVVVV